MRAAGGGAAPSRGAMYAAEDSDDDAAHPGCVDGLDPSNRDATSRGSTFARSENVSGADTFRISPPLTAR